MSQPDPTIQALRDKMRARTIGAPRTFERISGQEIELVTPGGVEKLTFDVVAPTAAARGAILAAAGVSALHGTVAKPAVLNAMYVIECVVVPGTDERVYTELDLESLTSRQINDWPDRLWQKVQPILGIDPVAAKKKSLTTPASEPSSASPAT